MAIGRPPRGHSTPGGCRWVVEKRLRAPDEAGTPRSRFCLDPSVEQEEVLARHAGASRFAFNQCLRMVKTALNQCKAEPGVEVPWTGFDLIKRVQRVEEDRGRGPRVHGRQRWCRRDRW